jgi:hypothetical protein
MPKIEIDMGIGTRRFKTARLRFVFGKAIDLQAQAISHRRRAAKGDAVGVMSDSYDRSSFVAPRADDVLTFAG